MHFILILCRTTHLHILLILLFPPLHHLIISLIELPYFPFHFVLGRIFQSIDR